MARTHDPETIERLWVLAQHLPELRDRLERLHAKVQRSADPEDVLLAAGVATERLVKAIGARLEHDIPERIELGPLENELRRLGKEGKLDKTEVDDLATRVKRIADRRNLGGHDNKVSVTQDDAVEVVEHVVAMSSWFASRFRETSLPPPPLARHPLVRRSINVILPVAVLGLAGGLWFGLRSPREPGPAATSLQVTPALAGPAHSAPEPLAAHHGAASVRADSTDLGCVVPEGSACPSGRDRGGTEPAQLQLTNGARRFLLRLARTEVQVPGDSRWQSLVDVYPGAVVCVQINAAARRRNKPPCQRPACIANGGDWEHRVEGTLNDLIRAGLYVELLDSPRGQATKTLAVFNRVLPKMVTKGNLCEGIEMKAHTEMGTGSKYIKSARIRLHLDDAEDPARGEHTACRCE